MKLEPRAFLVASGCASLAWVAAATGQADASVANLAAATLDVLAVIAGVWFGSVAIVRSRPGTWGADGAPGWMHAAVVAVAAVVAEAGDAALAAAGMPVEADAGPMGREALQATAFAAAFWAAYLLTARAVGAAVVPAAVAGSHEVPAPGRSSAEIAGEIAPTTAPGLLRLVRDPRVLASLEIIKAEGNYVDVLGAEGHELILYRFNQAVEELAGIGMQVHRSYWVRRSAVRDMQRSGRTGRLTLASGRRVPVSAPYLAAAQSLLQVPSRDAV